MPEPAAIAGMQVPPQPIPPADPNESALLRRLIDERSRFEWSAEQTARWERDNPRDILRSLAVALCEMDEGEVGEELVRMKDEEVEEECLRRLIEGKGLSQPDIDDWIRDNPDVGLGTLAMMVADMTIGGIQVELAGIRREAGEGQESGGAAEGGEGRGETRLGIAEGGEREEAVEEDAAEEEGHEWDNKVAGGDTDSSPSSEEREKRASIKRQATSMMRLRFRRRGRARTRRLLKGCNWKSTMVRLSIQAKGLNLRLRMLMAAQKETIDQALDLEKRDS